MMILSLAFAVAAAASPVGETVEGGVATLRFSDGSSREIPVNGPWPDSVREPTSVERFELRVDRFDGLHRPHRVEEGRAHHGAPRHLFGLCPGKTLPSGG